jgi:hypothetical protein
MPPHANLFTNKYFLCYLESLLNQDFNLQNTFYIILKIFYNIIKLSNNRIIFKIKLLNYSKCLNKTLYIINFENKPFILF